MNINILRVLFFLVLFVFAAIDFGLSALFPKKRVTDWLQVAPGQATLTGGGKN